MSKTDSGHTGQATMVMDEPRAAAGSGRYLTFTLGGHLYALGILEITEIIEFRGVTVVPMTPQFIRGVINLRGRVVPVVDLAARFGRGATEVGRRTSIIIVEADSSAAAYEGGSDAAGGDDESGSGGPTGSPGVSGVGQDMGMMVDAVNKVVYLSAEDIEPPPAFGAGIRSDFISGMAKCDDGFTIILDAGKVLSLDEMLALGEIVAAQQSKA